jgi:hypothetical protein
MALPDRQSVKRRFSLDKPGSRDNFDLILSLKKDAGILQKFVTPAVERTRENRKGYYRTTGDLM